MSTELDRALFDAAASPEVDAAVIRALIARGADPDARFRPDHFLFSDACSALSAHLLRPEVEPDPAVLEALLDGGASVDLPSERKQRRALHIAAWTFRAEVARLLLARGADPSARCEDDQCATPLLACLRFSSADWEPLVVLLLDHGADPDGPGTWVRAPLHQAVSLDMLDAVEYLIGAGVSLEGWHDAGHTPGRTPLQEALWGSRPLSTVQRLLDLGADPDGAGSRDIRPLHTAAWERRLDGVELLLRVGAQVDPRDVDGRTPLHRALARPAGVELVEALLRGGADPNAADGEGARPLHLAATSVEHTRALLAAGADPRLGDAQGRLPRELAEGLDLVVALLEPAAVAQDGPLLGQVLGQLRAGLAWSDGPHRGWWEGGWRHEFGRIWATKELSQEELEEQLAWVLLHGPQDRAEATAAWLNAGRVATGLAPVDLAQIRARLAQEAPQLVQRVGLDARAVDFGTLFWEGLVAGASYVRHDKEGFEEWSLLPGGEAQHYEAGDGCPEGQTRTLTRERFEAVWSQAVHCVEGRVFGNFSGHRHLREALDRVGQPTARAWLLGRG